MNWHWCNMLCPDICDYPFFTWNNPRINISDTLCSGYKWIPPNTSGLWLIKTLCNKLVLNIRHETVLFIVQSDHRFYFRYQTRKTRSIGVVMQLKICGSEMWQSHSAGNWWQMQQHASSISSRNEILPLNFAINSYYLRTAPSVASQSIN